MENRRIQQDMPPAAAYGMELGMANDKRELMIYIHIPYCIRKCLYCDFLSFGKGSSQWESIDKYIDTLCHEIKFYKEYSKDRIVTSVFIGGGTPSVLTNSQADKLFAAIRSGFMLSKDCEFTIECNPGTLTADKLKLYRTNGVNRISLGLQSADNAELKVLGRIHTFEDFARSFDAVREAGFENVNVDLMSAIPGQTMKNWENTLIKTLSFKPEHISAYSLIIEEETPFYDMYCEAGGRCEAVGNLEAGKGCEAGGDRVLKLPDEDTEREIYHFTKDFLGENGYYRYEISNYSLPGYECRHNSGYWQGKDYLGLGLGAASLFEGRRYANVRELEAYLEAVDKARDKVIDKTENNSTDKAGDKAVDKDEDKVGNKTVDKAGDKTVDKVVDKAGDKTVDKTEEPENAGLVLQADNGAQALPFADKDEQALQTADKKSVQASPWVDEETIQLLSQKERMEEFMFLGLRMCKGISMADFKKCFGKNIYDIYGEVLGRLMSEGLIEQQDDFLRLTDYGVDLSNYVLAEFLL
ncbi:MAG: radical SAM family heme chaperone HemW [Lachnospiraceae bacterium]|nr:radical SAM family heme chaperone HemW [Lachnospiraceae bacterium]